MPEDRSFRSKASPARRRCPLPADFDSIRSRVILAANGLERRALVRQGYGAQVCPVTADDLLQHVAIRFFEQRPPFDPEKQTLLEWAQRRMKDEFDRVLGRAENDWKRYSYINSSHDPDNEALGVESLNKYREDLERVHRHMVARSFLHWLAAYEPALFPVAQLMIVSRITERADLCRQLQLADEECKHLIAGIKRAIPRFHRAIAKSEGDG